MIAIVWLFVTLSVVCAHNTDESVHHRHNSSMHSDCFDVFIPLVNRLSHEAKEASENCAVSAHVEKEREIAAIKNTRSELSSEVKRIKESLAHCSSRTDHLGYFECLNGIIEFDKKVVGEIALKSSMFSNKLQKIKEQETNCFRNSVIKVKDKMSNGIHNLRYCLVSEDSPNSRERLNTEPYRDVLTTRHFKTSTSHPEPTIEYDEDNTNYLYT